MSALCPKCVATSGGYLCISDCPVIENVARVLAARDVPDHEDHYWRAYIADARNVISAVDRARSDVPREAEKMPA